MLAGQVHKNWLLENIKFPCPFSLLLIILGMTHDPPCSWWLGTGFATGSHREWRVCRPSLWSEQHRHRRGHSCKPGFGKDHGQIVRGCHQQGLLPEYRRQVTIPGRWGPHWRPGLTAQSWCRGTLGQLFWTEPQFVCWDEKLKTKCHNWEGCCN